MRRLSPTVPHLQRRIVPVWNSTRRPGVSCSVHRVPLFLAPICQLSWPNNHNRIPWTRPSKPSGRRAMTAISKKPAPPRGNKRAPCCRLLCRPIGRCPEAKSLAKTKDKIYAHPHTNPTHRRPPPTPRPALFHPAPNRRKLQTIDSKAPIGFVPTKKTLAP